jgi:tRNA G18 (ribose-2'-O)-methylase SpoU
MIDVARLDDERVADYRLVSDPHALRARGLFVAEGRLVVARLLPLSAHAGHPFEATVRSVLVTPAARDRMGEVLGAYPDLPVYVVSQAVMDDLGGFNFHRGCLALASRPAARLLDRDHLADRTRVIVLEGVNNPDNVGGILRSAAAFAADLVVFGPRCADALYRKTIRTSMGGVFEVPWVEAGPWTPALDALRASGLRLIALTPAREACRLRDLAPGGRVALLAGAEGAGLTSETLAAADACVRIPMTARVASLNVATAVSIALHHLYGA